MEFNLAESERGGSRFEAVCAFEEEFVWVRSVTPSMARELTAGIERVPLSSAFGTAMDPSSSGRELESGGRDVDGGEFVPVDGEEVRVPFGIDLSEAGILVCSRCVEFRTAWQSSGEDQFACKRSKKES